MMYRRNRAKQLTPWQRRLSLMGGPALTCMLVTGVLASSCLLLFRSANDRVAMALKRAAVSFGVAAMLACLTCHVVDPGSPKPDLSDPGPVDENDETLRVREASLPNGKIWRQKWCRECRLWRPHRCGHCHNCDRCVLRLDHHCGFMGACVGERNCRFFAAFLLCAGLGIACLIALGVYRMSTLHCWSDTEVWLQSWEPAGIVIFFFCCPPIPLPICLVAQSLGLTGAGVGYCGLMTADTDVHSPDGWNVLEELRGFFTCRGLWAYCCSPVRLAKASAAPTADNVVPLARMDA